MTLLDERLLAADVEPDSIDRPGRPRRSADLPICVSQRSR